jgi:hypothetical protein
VRLSTKDGTYDVFPLVVEFSGHEVLSVIGE